MQKLTHLDDQGNATMVNIAHKTNVHRTAIAEGYVCISKETRLAIQQNTTPKGNVLSIAQLAGIIGSKHTSTIIPLCHPIPIDSVDVQIELQDNKVYIQSTVQNIWKTGVEMEALTAVTVSALTIYDMLKAIDKSMTIDGIKLIEKTKTPIS